MATFSDMFVILLIYLLTCPGSNTPQSTNLLSWKLSKLDEPDMQDTAGEAETSS